MLFYSHVSILLEFNVNSPVFPVYIVISITDNELQYDSVKYICRIGLIFSVRNPENFYIFIGSSQKAHILCKSQCKFSREFYKYVSESFIIFITKVAFNCVSVFNMSIEVRHGFKYFSTKSALNV